jgi:hypothetical protein
MFRWVDEFLLKYGCRLGFDCNFKAAIKQK